MKNRIELLIKLGLSEIQATEFVKNIADESYSDGYSEGMDDKPGIIGESLGQSGMDFYDWWNIKINQENKPLLYSELKPNMFVKDELGRFGQIKLFDDIDNIMVAFNNHTEYFSLDPNNTNGVSNLYIA